MSSAAETGCGCGFLLILAVGASSIYQGCVKAVPTAKPPEPSIFNLYTAQPKPLRDQDLTEPFADFLRDQMQIEFALFIEMSDEIDRRQAKLDQLAADLKKLNRWSSWDPDYTRWSTQIATLRSKRTSILEVMKDAFIAFRKTQLSPGPDSSRAFDELLEKARASAATSGDSYREALKEMERP